MNISLQPQMKSPVKSSFTPVHTDLLQHKCAACGQHSSAVGECEECNNSRLRGARTKLAFSQSGDPYEQEADRVAAQIMRMSDLGPAGARAAYPTAPSIQLKPAGEGAEQSGEPLVNNVISSPGEPLDLASRAFFELRFGHNFSQVRVHADERAAESAAAIKARAYTAGQHVVFGARQFAPESAEGRRLIAHELTHVIQQSGSDSLGVQRQEPPREEPVATSTTTEAAPTTTTTSTTAPTKTATPVPPGPAKLSGKTWWDANENKAPYIKSADISDLESDFQTKVNELKGALDTAGASISIDTTKRPAERAYILHYAWVIAKDGFKASEVPAKENVDIVWDHGDDTKSKAGANEIITAAAVASTPSLTSNHIAGKAIDWAITWTTDLKIEKKDATVTEIKSEPRNGGDPGNTELHAVGKSYGVIKGIFTKKDPPHWSSDGT